MSTIDIDDVSSGSSVDTFAPVAVYRLKYYKPQSLFDNVLYALIRPPRFVYNQKLLVPGRRYRERFDYEVHNIPFPLSIYWAQNPQYIILYLHGNSSSRFEGYLHLKQLPEGACLACFDFKGCGLRKDGKYITLGKQECVEVDMAVQYLKTYGYPIVGWGRSMGAVSLLMSSKCQIMIADSPFASLYNLCKQTSLNFVPAALCCLVHCFFPCIFCCVRNGVQNKSGMDPNQLEIINAVQKIPSNKSLLIMAGKQDSMIHYSHASRLFEAFSGKNKRIILFDGNHNSTRPSEVLDECFEFIDACIEQCQNGKGKVQNPSDYNSQSKVLKIDRQSSKQSLIVNHQTVPMVDQRELQTSKQTLIANLKAPIQLRPLKVGPSKSSPQKLAKIQGDYQFTQQANIQIDQQQDIIREGIGRFQTDLSMNPDQKITFKFISKKNQIQNIGTPSIQLKAIKPIQQIHLFNQKPESNNADSQSNKKEELGKNSKSKQQFQTGKSLANFINFAEPENKTSQASHLHQRKQKKQEKALSPTKIREQGIDQMKEKATNASQIKKLEIPSSRHSPLLYEDVKLLDQEIESVPDRESTKELIKQNPIEVYCNFEETSPSRKLVMNDRNMTPRVESNAIPIELDNNRVSADNLKLKKAISKKRINCEQIHDAQILQIHDQQGKNDAVQQHLKPSDEKNDLQFTEI